MKNLILSFLLLIVFQASAQYGSLDSRPNYPQPKKGEKIDPIESSVNYLKKELNLDDFQAAAIKNEFIVNQKEVEKTIELPILYEEKVEKVKILREKLNGQIAILLSDEQKQKFDLLQKKNEKKGKKDKKNKDN